MGHRDRRVAIVALTAVLTVASQALAQGDALTPDQKRAFLRTADVIAAEQTSSGVTQPWRLTLTDGTLTHDAVFQSVDQRSDNKRLGNRRELNFVDSYRYNIAAYELAVLIGLEGMVPVTVERKWKGKTGALSWWIDDVMFDEKTRIEERQSPDDVAAWSEQMSRTLVFAALVHDTDRNRTNLLYTRDWKVYMIDFSRAFRLWDTLREPENLIKIDAELLERVRRLSERTLKTTLDRYLTGAEINGVAKRAKRLVDHFDRLIATKGEALVLN